MINLLSENIAKTLAAADGRGQENESAPIVLIVDDDADNRSMMKFLLEMWKYPVVEAADGIEAIKIVKKVCPDLILMDVRLPHLDGFDTTSQIRQSEVCENIPIIFLSACADVSSKQKGFAVGGNEYLTKPLNFEELEKIIFKYVRCA